MPVFGKMTNRTTAVTQGAKCHSKYSRKEADEITVFRGEAQAGMRMGSGRGLDMNKPRGGTRLEERTVRAGGRKAQGKFGHHKKWGVYCEGSWRR